MHIASALQILLFRRWICVYPAYINKRKSVSEGRRIARQYTVDNPLCTEIRDVCLSQQLNAEVENNHYPREQAKDHIHSGRVRVQLKQADGSYLNSDITSSESLTNYYTCTVLILILCYRKAVVAEVGRIDTKTKESTVQ